MRYIEEIVEIVIDADENFGTKTITPPKGKIVGVVAYPDTIDGKDRRTNLAISYDGGEVISKNQDIRNYRSREAAYSESFKPVIAEGGKAIKVDMFSKEAFTELFACQVIFLYEQPQCID